MNYKLKQKINRVIIKIEEVTFPFKRRYHLNRQKKELVDSLGRRD